MKSEQIDKVANALAKAQGELRNAAFNRVNPHFKNKYADLAAVFDAVRVPFSKHELAVTQTTDIRDGQMILVTTIAHSSGQWIESAYPLPMNGRPQELGSALTYARRYSLSSIAGIAADDDDDAETAEKVHKNGNGNGHGVKISDQQVETLQAAIVEVGADVNKFLSYLKVDSISDIPTIKYAAAMAALEAKRVRQ